MLTRRSLIAIRWRITAKTPTVARNRLPTNTTRQEATETIATENPLDRTHWKKLTCPELFEKLVAKAREGLRGKFWGNGAIPDGTTGETLALDTIEDVLLGRASWNPETDPDPYHKLANIVDTKVANLVRSYRNRNAKFLAKEFDEPGSDDSDVAELLQTASTGTFMARVKETLSGFPELIEYVEAASVFDKRSDIATMLGVEPSEVTNRQKRVQRIFAGLADEFGVSL